MTYFASHLSLTTSASLLIIRGANIYNETVVQKADTIFYGLPEALHGGFRPPSVNMGHGNYQQVDVKFTHKEVDSATCVTATWWEVEDPVVIAGYKYLKFVNA